jgi:hypothetical protein
VASVRAPLSSRLPASLRAFQGRSGSSGVGGAGAGAWLGSWVCPYCRQDFVAEAGVSRKSVGTSGLKSSGGRDVGLGLARFFFGFWPFVRWAAIWYAVRRYGRCCMYGPNYVKLS